MMRIGAQFYTVRDYCKTLSDFADTLAKVAEMGYEYVQVSGTCAYEPAWLAEQLKKNGLSCIITHTPGDRMVATPEAVAAEHDVFDCRYVGLGSGKFEADRLQTCYDAFVADYRPAAQKLKDCGKYFMYHNHAHEFQKLDGKLILERLAEDFSPEIMGFTLDTYWVQVGGGDPAQWLERLSGRVPVIHLKDYSYTTERQMAVIGEGNLNFDRIFEKAESAGTQYMMVEQDHCYGEDPLACLKRSCDFLRSHGFR